MASPKGKAKIVAVDGPAGSGKSSVCAEVCRQLGWTYINTGAIYRAVAVVARRLGTSLEQEGVVAALCDQIASGLRWDGAEGRLTWREIDLTADLGSASAGSDASHVAKMPLVREKLLPIQRKLALKCEVGAIVDGRDIGTVVFPDADLKVFMTASLEARAKRRLDQLHGLTPSDAASGADSLEGVMRQIAARDEQDASRGAAPMKMASDAIEFDTSAMNKDETIARLVQLIRAKGL